MTKSVKQAKAASLKALESYKHYPKSKGKKAKSLRKAAYISAHARYASLCKKNVSTELLERPITFKIDVFGLLVRVVESNSSFYIISDFDSKTETAITEILQSMLDCDSFQDVMTLSKKADLATTTEIFLNAAA